MSSAVKVMFKNRKRAFVWGTAAAFYPLGGWRSQMMRLLR